MDGDEDKENRFDSKAMAISLQKKILGKMLASNKKVAKLFIDEKSSKLLDAFYSLCKKALGNKKEAESLVKRIMKTCIKIGILGKNGKFNVRELGEAQKFQQTFRTLVLTIISFAEVDYSFDKAHLTKLLLQSKGHIKLVIADHLSEKSIDRIDQIYGVLTDSNFIDGLFFGNSARACGENEAGNSLTPSFNSSKDAKILLEAFRAFADQL